MKSSCLAALTALCTIASWLGQSVTQAHDRGDPNLANWGHKSSSTIAQENGKGGTNFDGWGAKLDGRVSNMRQSSITSHRMGGNAIPRHHPPTHPPRTHGTVADLHVAGGRQGSIVADPHAAGEQQNSGGPLYPHAEGEQHSSIDADSHAAGEQHKNASPSYPYSEGGRQGSSGDPLYDLIAALVEPYGYPLELHWVVTEDGYVLRLYRIPSGLGSKAGVAPQAAAVDSGGVASPAAAVLLQHGLLDSCAGFLLNGPKQSLAFLLADEGYDVWLGNSRGSTHSRNHTRFSVDSQEFWAFSYDQMASYDLPAMVEHIQNVTKHQKIAYVGHSQGTTVLMAALASQPQLARHLKISVLLAPVAFAQHMKSLPLAALSALGTPSLIALLGVHEFLPSQQIIAHLEGALCFAEPALCVNIVSAICGYNVTNVDASRLATYVQYTPAGTSVQNMAHWAQSVRQEQSVRMVHYDYGNECKPHAGYPIGTCNQVMYGEMAPPSYELGSITTPIALFHGGNDRLADPTDVEYLREALAQGTIVHDTSIEGYEHLDFIWGKSASALVYQPVLQLLNSYH